MSEPKERKPREKWVTIQRLGSGWAAVIMWMSPPDPPMNPEPWIEPYDTGIGRYLTKEEAEKEAVKLADAYDIEYEMAA